MRNILITFIILAFPGSVFSDSSNFLIGKWVSDKEATIEYNEGKVKWTEDQRKFFENNLGKLRLNFTEGTVQLYFEEDLGKSKYEIIKRGPSYLVIRTETSKEEREFFGNENPYRDIKYYIEGERIYTEPNSSKLLLREYFRKAK